MVEWIEDGEVSIHVEPGPLALSPSLREAIDRYWEEEVRTRHPEFFRGPLLTVRKLVKQHGQATVYAQFTEFAHYLYSRACLSPDDPSRVRVLFGAGCPVTRDDRLVVGIMGPRTARPGWVQTVGGAAILEDVEEGRFLADRSVRRELREEVGIAADDALWVRKMETLGCTVDANGSIAVVVRIGLSLTADAVLAEIRRFIRRVRDEGGEPELTDVAALLPGPEGLRQLEAMRRPTVRYLRKILETNRLFAGTTGNLPPHKGGPG